MGVNHVNFLYSDRHLRQAVTELNLICLHLTDTSRGVSKLIDSLNYVENGQDGKLKHLNICERLDVAFKLLC